MPAWGGRVNDKNAAPAPDVVIIGGGVIGLSIAWRAATAGMAVAVVDESAQKGASWASAGLLAPVTEVHHGEEQVLELGVASLEMYPSFVAELEDLTGASVGYRSQGTLIVAPNADDFAALGELYKLQQELGLVSRALKRRDARVLEPSLAPAFRAAWLIEGDHQVDSRALADALETACRMSGVQMITDVAVAIDAESDRVRGVRLAGHERLACDRVVLAAGCWSGAIAGIPDEVRPPVRPVKGQLLYLRGPADPPLIAHNVRGLDVYLVPRRDGRIVVGATVEEQGFDTTVTAAAVYELLRDAYELVPALGELELFECVAGLRPGSPDNAPMLGESGLEGLLVATGHYRSGILLTPLTAEMMTELLVTGRTPAMLQPVSPQRFALSKGGVA
jgi:glycine oxidase